MPEDAVAGPGPEPLAYGAWPSPISAALVSAGGVRLDGPAVRTGSDGSTEIWWCESRPAEGGRAVLVRRREGGEPEDVLAGPWSARTRVHEYGGGAWFTGGHDVYFSHDDDQRLYRLPAHVLDSRVERIPVPLTPAPPTRHALRYADGRETPDGVWVMVVREDHRAPGEATNELVAIAADGSSATGDGPTVLVSGPDFVAAPRISPDGRWLAWIQWNHPNMPWDGTELCAAPLFDGARIGNVQVVAGSDAESVIGHDWTSEGRLVYSTDASGWWNLHAWTPGSDTSAPMTTCRGSEIGSPPWVFGLCPWVEVGEGRLVAIETTRGVDRLAVVGPDGALQPIETPFVSFSGLAVSPGGQLLALAQTGTDLQAIVEIAPDGRWVSHRPADEIGVDPAWYSEAEAFTFASTDDRTAHAFFYPPTAPDNRAGLAGELPPLIVVGHGGPTSHSAPILDLKIQYWTSRGFAVASVNYGGSSGHGRDYRRLLDGAWGVVDVDDCVSVARALAHAGRVDPERMAIRGSSAGGFTVLAALTQHQVFSAGTSLYGIGDLAALAADTHKFESRYCDRLIGPYPEAEAVYRERSPLSHTDRFTCPLLVLQGTEDEIVPPSQAQAIVSALAASDLPHAVIYFDGEQHGFRRAESIVRSLEAELWFYGRVFGFDPADAIEPVTGSSGL